MRLRTYVPKQYFQFECIGPYGPFPFGSYPDITIFRMGLKQALNSSEMGVADGGYNDEKCRTPSGLIDTASRMESFVRARHETVNHRFKQFFALEHRFRHDISLHSACFHAVASLR